MSLKANFTIDEQLINLINLGTLGT